MAEFTTFPENLPVPEDDGACDHLEGSLLPSIPLPATTGDSVDLSKLSGTTVVFSYPRTGVPGAPHDIDFRTWDLIPGARGCTPQACGFRDHFTELSEELGVRVFGLSTLTTAHQSEAASRLQLPFPLLSDSDLTYTHALKLPTFVYESVPLLKRNAIVIKDGKITKVFYPVFPPDENAKNVVKFLRELKKK